MNGELKLGTLATVIPARQGLADHDNRMSKGFALIDRALCRTRIDYFPPWPCPACRQGSVQCEPKSIRRWPAKGVVFAIDEGYIFRWDEYGVFSVTLKCSNFQCSQGIAVLGDYSADLIDGQQMTYDLKYTVRDIHPAILLINIPENNLTPEAIAGALFRSFALYWRDPQACAASIRSAIEGISDHLGQPRKVKGRFVPLGRRLINLKAQYPELVEAAEAIKDIGNEGAHGDTVDRDKLLTSYELLEIELRTLFNDDAVRRRALIADLRS